MKCFSMINERVSDDRNAGFEKFITIHFLKVKVSLLEHKIPLYYFPRFAHHVTSIFRIL